MSDNVRSIFQVMKDQPKVLKSTAPAIKYPTCADLVLRNASAVIPVTTICVCIAKIQRHAEGKIRAPLALVRCPVAKGIR
jgi:hypothetical protein